MKRVISFMLTIVVLFGMLSFTTFAEDGEQENEFSNVSYTDMFYGYSWYLSHYNNEMRTSLTEPIINAGEQFGADDKFWSTLETTLDTVGSFSKTFFALTDAVGLTSRLNDNAADAAISAILKDIYQDKDSEFWKKIINSESNSIQALQGSLDFINSFNQAGFENYTLNEIYEEILSQSIEKTAEYNVAIGKLSMTNRSIISKTVYDYYSDYITDWEQIVNITKCVNTILFYQNVEIELIDYILEFDNLDEDLIKGLNRVKSYITSNYATYFVEKITKKVIDETLDKIGDFFGSAFPVAKLASTACQFGSWLFFDVIYNHPDAEEYLTYIYLVKFLYSGQYEMNNKLLFLNTDLVYSKTIDDFEYFYKIYSAIFKTAKMYAEKLLGENIDFEYQNNFFECSAFIEYSRIRTETIEVDSRVEKAYIYDKTYQFDEPVIISNENKDAPCLVTFHNKIMAPLIVDENVKNIDCDLVVPGLTINRSLTINTNFTVDGGVYSDSSAVDEIRVVDGGCLNVSGDAMFGTGDSYEDRITKLIIEANSKINVENDFNFNGRKGIGGGFNYNYLYIYGNLNIKGDLNTNSVIRIYNYGNIEIGGSANFIAQKHHISVTHGHIYLYSNSTCYVGGSFNLQGMNYYNTGNNWFSLHLDGELIVNGSFSASNKFVAINQTSPSSLLIVKGGFFLKVLNETWISGFDWNTDKGYKCFFTAGTLIVSGNFLNDSTVTFDESYKIVLNGLYTQSVRGLVANNLVISNTKGVEFKTAVTVSTLFDHQGNAFTLYNDGKGSSFADYDGDGMKDHVDPEPTVGNSCTLHFESEDIEKGTVSTDEIHTYGGTEITVTATPTAKYTFSKWINSSGTIVSESATLRFRAATSETYTAIFNKRVRPITIQATGGIINAPSNAEIESLVYVSVSENPGYVYTEGSLAYNSNTIENGCFVMPDEQVNLTAEFVKNENYFALNDVLNTAKEYSYQMYSEESFEKLTNAIDSAQTALVNTITKEESDENIASLQEAIDGLQKKVITINFESEDIEKGSVSQSEFQTFYGTELTITATPTAKYEFSKWVDSNGTTISTNASFSLTAINNETYTALFTKRWHPIVNDYDEGYYKVATIDVPQMAEVDSEVHVSMYVKPGYVYVEGSLTYNGAKIENNSFIMPNEVVYLTAEFVKNENYFALKDALNTAKDYTYLTYSKESFAKLSAAINDANAALVNTITAEESSKHISLLQEAIDGLQERFITKIEVTTLPNKVNYLESKELLDVTGGKVTLYYDNDVTEVIDLTSSMISGFNNIEIGEQELTVAYQGFTNTFKIKIIEKSLISIELTTLPTNVVYLEEKDPLDVTGGKVTLCYNNDTSEVIDLETSMVTGFDNTKVGKQELTVSYQDFETVFEIEVIAKAVDRIEVTTLPAKLTYIQKTEELDLTGGKLTLHYNNDTTEEIDLAEAEVSGFNNTIVGENTLTIVYEEKETTFEVEILERPKTIGGAVTFLGEGEATLRLMQNGETAQTVTTEDGAYLFEGIYAGDYTIEISKANHAVKTFDLTVEEDDIDMDFDLYMMGDVNNDRKVTIADVVMVLRVLNENLDAQYIDETAANVIAEDNELTIADAIMILRHVMGKASLYSAN